VSIVDNFKERYQAFDEQYGKLLPAAFFVGGFGFDLLFTGRIDESFSLIQQAVYLFLIGLFLFLEVLNQENKFTPFRGIQTLWKYHREILHFFLGSLLSIYSIFYFKSSSLIGSFAFLFFIAIILIANELPKFQEAGYFFRFALFSLCLASYANMIIPMGLSYVGVLPFVLALSFSVLVGLWIYLALKKRCEHQKRLLKEVVLPFFGVNALFLVFYIFSLIPPVPVSAKHMGIYHRVEKQGDQYLLYHERPWWKFWQEGDQDFTARPDDRIYVFASIFSPAAFHDQVKIRWLRYNERKGKWVEWDSLQMEIRGGRKEGYRGYMYKENYAEGEWQTRLESLDGREISRIYFDVEKSTRERGKAFKVEKF
jgi:hypothetical protein